MTKSTEIILCGLMCALTVAANMLLIRVIAILIGVAVSGGLIMIIALLATCAQLVCIFAFASIAKVGNDE